MVDNKEADGILYRHFTIMNRELEHLRGLINDLDSRLKHLQQALESLEGKSSSEDARLLREIETASSEVTNLNSELRKDHETLVKNVTEIDARLAEQSGELVQVKTRFEKELAPFTGPADKPEPNLKPQNEIEASSAKEQFIADLEAAGDSNVEELAETIESEEERKKKKRK